MLYDKVVELLEKGNAIGERNGVILDKILNALKNFNPGQGGTADYTDILEILEQILNKVTENVNATKDMDKNTQANFAIVIELLGQLGADGDKILQAIVNNGKMTKEQFEALRDLIIKNNNIAQGTQDLVAKLTAQQKADNEAIINAIKNIVPGGGGVSVDLSTIENLLKQLLAATNDGNKKLDELGIDMNNGLALVQSILLRIEDKIPEDQRDILLKIYNKIPEGCHCNIDEILVKLEVIIEKLEDQNGNHEGILEDLDDLFG